MQWSERHQTVIQVEKETTTTASQLTQEEWMQQSSWLSSQANGGAWEFPLVSHPEKLFAEVYVYCNLCEIRSKALDFHIQSFFLHIVTFFKLSESNSLRERIHTYVRNVYQVQPYILMGSQFVSNLLSVSSSCLVWRNRGNRMDLILALAFDCFLLTSYEYYVKECSL